MLAEDELAEPRRAATARRYSPLTPDGPAQTPVSWSTFSTGLDPGGHEIFDFLKRDPSNIQPELRGRRGDTVPFLFGTNDTRPLRRGRAAIFLLPRSFAVSCAGGGRPRRPRGSGAGRGGRARTWRRGLAAPDAAPRARTTGAGALLGDAAAASRDGHAHAGDLPARAVRTAAMLSGLGVPDLSGRIGKPFYFTSELFFPPREGDDFSIEIVELEANKGVRRPRSRARPAVPSAARATHRRSR